MTERAFDRVAFKAHLRRLTKDFREVRRLAEQIRAWEEGLGDDQAKEMVGGQRGEFRRQYREAWSKIHRFERPEGLWPIYQSERPRGLWPVVFAPMRRPDGGAYLGKRWAYEDPWAGPASASIVHVPVLALDWPVSKPFLEIVRPLLIEVQRWWTAVEPGATLRFAPGRRRYPPKEVIQRFFLDLRERFEQYVRSKPPDKPLVRWIRREDVVHALPSHSSEEDVDAVFDLLTGKGAGHGATAAAREAVCRALGVGAGKQGGDLRGQEYVWKLISSPTAKQSVSRSRRETWQGRHATRRVGVRGRGKLK